MSNNNGPEVANPFDEVQSTSLQDDKCNWYGLLIIFPYLKYYISVALWGTKAVDKPLPFIKTGNFEIVTYGFFRLKKNIIAFFCGPHKETRDLNFLEKITLLLEPGDSSDSTLQKCREFTHLHRLHENTKARKRLEKWASRLIVVYLFAVLITLFLNYTSITYTGIFSFMNKVTISIPQGVIITILSTTTVNIIGLGFIMLRGHFLSKNDIDDINLNTPPAQRGETNDSQQ